jgi:radical SAM superfamily enzyme YgiQ (UPF0313 family)
MKVLLIYLPFCTPVSPPYSLTNLYGFLSQNSSHEIKVLDLNLEFHRLKFKDSGKYFQSTDWSDYEKKSNKYHQATKKVYAENNSLVVQGKKPAYFQEILERINKENADLIAFSIVYSSQAFYAHALLKELKNTVIGGPAVNQKLIRLADHYFKNEVEFLNFIDEEKKHSELQVDFALDFSIYELGKYFTPAPVIPLKTSTTCYYQQCTFCAHFAKVPYKEYPLRNIEDTIIKSGMKHFFLIDDMIPVKRLLELSRIFKEHGAKWACQLRPTREFSPKVLDELFSSGLVFVLFGFESACQKTLDAIKKGTNVKDIGRVLDNSHKAGVKNVLYTMFGFPGETKGDFMETVDFLKKNSDNIDLVSVSTFGLHKGAVVYENPSTYGLTISEKERTILEPKISYSVENGLSPEEVKVLVKKFSKEIESVNKYPRSMNFFREHLFFALRRKS